MVRCLPKSLNAAWFWQSFLTRDVFISGGVFFKASDRHLSNPASAASVSLIQQRLQFASHKLCHS